MTQKRYTEIPRRFKSIASDDPYVATAEDIIDNELEQPQSVINSSIERKYNSQTPNGMGKVVLKKNKSFASQVTEPNTIYVIQYDFTLNGDITIPANCILEFDGGSISGAYTITGNNTGIEAGLVKIFGTDVTLAGTWNVLEAYSEWFGAKGDGATDDSNTIQKTINYFRTIGFGAKTYKCSVVISQSLTTVIGHQTTFIPRDINTPIFTVFNGINQGEQIEFCFIKNCIFRGVTNNCALLFRNVHNWRVLSCRVFRNKIGIENNGAYGGYITDTIIQMNDIAIYAHTDDEGFDGKEVGFFVVNGTIDNNGCALKTAIGQVGGRIDHISLKNVDMTINTKLCEINGRSTIVFDSIYYEKGLITGTAEKYSYIYFNNVSPVNPSVNCQFKGNIVINNSPSGIGTSNGKILNHRAIITNQGNVAGNYDGACYFLDRSSKINNNYDYLGFNGFKSIYQSIMLEGVDANPSKAELIQDMSIVDGAAEGLQGNYLHYENSERSGWTGFSKIIRIPNSPLVLTYAYRGKFNGIIYITYNGSTLFQHTINVSDSVNFVKGSCIVPILTDLDVKELNTTKITLWSMIDTAGNDVFFDWGELTLFDASADMNSVSIESIKKDPYIMTTDKPILNPRRGQSIFSRDLGKPIWWNGSGWVDVTGATV